MKELVLCDDCKPEFVIPLCEKYGFGIEIQGFYNPTQVKDKNKILKHYKDVLPQNISKYFHAPFADLCLGSATPKIVEATKYYFDYAYKMANKLGVKRITVHHGYIPGTSYSHNWIKKAVEFWKGYLRNKSICFDMENLCEEDGTISKEIVEKVNSDKLGLNLDIGHAHCNSKVEVLDWIKLLKDKITYVHLHDNHGETDEHIGLGKGTIPLKEVLKALNKYAPNAVWALECKLENLEESIKYLKDNKFI